MTDKKSNESRRQLLKSIAAGSGAVIAGKNLPEKWTKPVVDSVMLPAHAQTSPSTPTGCHVEVHGHFTDDKKQKIPSGASIPASTEIHFGVTVTPNPGAVVLSWGVSVNGGTPSNGTPMTNSNGVYASGLLANTFSPGDRLTMTFSYECSSITWSVNLT